MKTIRKVSPIATNAASTPARSHDQDGPHREQQLDGAWLAGVARVGRCDRRRNVSCGHCSSLRWQTSHSERFGIRRYVPCNHSQSPDRYEWRSARHEGGGHGAGPRSQPARGCRSLRRLCRHRLDVACTRAVDLVGGGLVRFRERLLDVLDPVVLEERDDAELPGGSTSSTSALISFFCRRSTIAPVPAPIPAPTAADARKAGGKIRPMIAPPTAPIAAPLPTSWASSLTSIFPSASRLTSTRPSTVIRSLRASSLMSSQSSWAAPGSG